MDNNEKKMKDEDAKCIGKKKHIQIHTSSNINYELINKNAEIATRMIPLHHTNTHTHKIV